MSETAPSPPLPIDLASRAAAVLDRIPRLLALQDRDPDSPTRGCLHPAYWRDKSSDLADMRRQEAALSFAWAYRYDFAGLNPWKGQVELLHAARRALAFWCRQQNKDGTFDEWYRGEHGYAATAFSSFAISLGVEALGEELGEPLRTQVLESLERSARWLKTHDDFFKTNHEAVGVGALAALARVLDDRSCEEAAERNAELIVSRITEEGWSKEISGLDIGYTFLLCEYLGMHAALSGVTRFIPDIARSFRFAATFLHPDLTSGGEYGICANPYVSRIAAELLAPHDSIAAAMVAAMKTRKLAGDLGATLEDDLRLARYAFQPLLAAQLHLGEFERLDLEDAPHPPATELFYEKSSGERWFPEAGLLAVARPGYCAWAAPAHGGLLRVAFRDRGGFAPPAVHRGYVLEDPDGTRSRNARYSREVKAHFDGSHLSVTAAMAALRFVMPPYWARVGLRIATSLPYGPKWSRWLIDRWRARKGTALNQSTAGVGGAKSPFVLERRIGFGEDEITLEDRISRNKGSGRWPSLRPVVENLRDEAGRGPDEDRRLGEVEEAPEDNAVRISAKLIFRDGSTVLRRGE